MARTVSEEDVGSSVPVVAIVASIVAVVVIAAGFYAYRSFSGDAARHHVTIATGSETGTYHSLGEALARILEGTAIVETAEVKATGGSVENMDLIGSGEGADLAFVQSDTPPATDARLIASLYDEVLHVLVSALHEDEVRNIYDLRGKRVSLGPEGSGTRQLSRRVLDHFGVAVGEDLAISTEEASDGLIDGSIEAAFVLTAIPSESVADLAVHDAMRCVSLGVGL